MTNLLLWILAIQLIGMVTFPLMYHVFKELPDRGMTLSKIFGLLLSTYLFWLLCLTGLVPNNRNTIIFILLVLIFVSGYVLLRKSREIYAFLRREVLHLVFGETIFLLIFTLWIVMASQVPSINHTEKLMDFGFINAILRSDSFPAEDVWFAGNSINYYHFGHLSMAFLTKLTGISSNISYNLSMALIPALVSIAAYGLTYNLMRASGVNRAISVLVGLIAPVFVGLIGNLVGVLDFVHARGWGSYGFWEWVGIKDLSRAAEGAVGLFPQDFNWWWHSTRVIDTIHDGQSLDYTITEFPFFSFLLGDLHAHVMSLPFLLLILSGCLNILLSNHPPSLECLWRRPWLYLSIALSLGTLAFVNIWDIPVFATFFVAVIFIWSLKYQAYGLRMVFLKTLFVAIPIILIAVLLYLPFYIDLRGPIYGILPLRDVDTRWFFFILLWGLFLIISLLLVVRQFFDLPAFNKTSMPIIMTSIVLTCSPIIIWWISLVILGPHTNGLGHALTMLVSKFAKLLPLLFIIGLSMYSAAIRAEKGPMPLVFSLIAISLAFYLLMAAELFYVEDLLPLRMNTVFKFYYQSWLLLSISSAFGVYFLFSQIRSDSRSFKVLGGFTIGLVGILFLASLYYPAGAYLNRVNSSSDQPTLNGLSFISKLDQDEYDAIITLRDHVPKGRVVEAVGGDYTAHGRIAASTGLPSPLNWPGHELQWRGSKETIRIREADVATIYQSRDIDEVRAILGKYEIRYVYVGNRERARYGSNIEVIFSQMMPVVFQRDNVTIYEMVRFGQFDGHAIEAIKD